MVNYFLVSTQVSLFPSYPLIVKEEPNRQLIGYPEI